MSEVTPDDRAKFSGSFISDFETHTTEIVKHVAALEELAKKCEEFGFKRAARRTKTLVSHIATAFQLTRDM
ncbi:MAG: hypothetical protein ACKO0Z_06990 [Betaproteobacteria bacterium]